MKATISQNPSLRAAKKNTGCRTIRRRALLWAGLLLSGFACHSQSPGGVSSNLQLWLKANEGATPSTQGANITNWTDESTGGNHATYISTAFSQTVVPPTFQQNTINFNPSVHFPGTSNTSFSALQGSFSPAITSNNISAYAVYIMNPGTSGSGRVFCISQGPLVSDWQNMNGADLISRNGANVYGTRNNTSQPIVGPVVGLPAALTSVHYTGSDNILAEVNGASFSTSAFTTAAFNAGTYRLGISTFSANDYLNGDIAEVILYNTDQSATGTNHNQVESYLAVKYGIHKPGNYVNSAGTVIWDAAANAAYHHDVFGIGHDNTSGLLQTQSNSMNTGSGNGAGQSGKGNIILSGASALSDMSYLLIGHSMNALNFSTNGVPASLPAGFQKMARTWHSEATGSIGTVTLRFDATGINIPGGASNLVLLLDTDGDGDFTTGVPVQIAPSSVAGNVLTFNNVNLSLSTIFSFGIQPIAAPGGAVSGIELWLDAANGATATAGNLTGWTDRSAINTFTVSATPPTVVTNAINFHPAVNFSNSTPITAYPATQNLTGNASVTYADAYGVFKVNNGSGGTIIGSIAPGGAYGQAVFSESGSRMYSGTGTINVYSSFPFTDYTNYHVFGMDASVAGMTGRMDGANEVMTNNTDFSSASFVPAVGTTNNSGNAGGWNHLNGQIAEVVVYNQTTAAQRINIESYLAIKYGIHKAGNYVSSANTIVWDSTVNAAYHNDVFGIGRDDPDSLNQVMSNSMNTGSGNGNGQSGKGNIVISTSSALTSNSFLMLGHNTNDFSLVSTNMPAGSPANFNRLNRTWKTQTTGSVGTVSLQFDVTGLNIPDSLTHLKLLVDADGDGNFASGTVTQYAAASVAGNIVQFNNVSLPADATLTFATLGVMPGGVPGSVAWYKANTGVTLNSGNISQWNDQSGNNNDATQGAATNQPMYSPNSVNFNQALTFNAPTSTRYMTTPVTGFPTGSAARSVFIVASSSNTQTANSWIFGYASPDNTICHSFAVGKITSNNALFASGYACDAQVSTYNFWGTPNQFKLGTVTYSSPTVSFFDAGANIGTATQNTWNTAATFGRIGIFPKVVPASELWSGNIAEIILYPSLVTGLDAQKIESYLAVKYGIHKAGNYVNSTGTVVWDSTANAAYHNDVFGIGRDDPDSLNQVISNSMNTGSGNGVGQSGKGNIVLSNPSALANKSFLMVGHNANDFSLATSNLPTVLAGSGYQRLNRSWKVQETGTTGSVSLSFETTGITSLTNVADTGIKLIIDHSGTGDFTAGPPTVEVRSADAVTGGVVTFNNVTFSPAVFTFATIPPVPLPVTLTSFTAQETACNEVTLKWNVADAIQFRSFEVERNTNNKGFDPIAALPYQPGQNSYSFTDSHLANGNYQYLLKLTEVDGSFKSSPIVSQSVNCTGSSGKIRVIPTPSHDYIYVQGFSNRAEIRILNLFGQVVIKAANVSEADRINIDGLPAAPYMIQVVQNGAVTDNAKMIKE